MVAELRSRSTVGAVVRVVTSTLIGIAMAVIPVLCAAIAVYYAQSMLVAVGVDALGRAAAALGFAAIGLYGSYTIGEGCRRGWNES